LNGARGRPRPGSRRSTAKAHEAIPAYLKAIREKLTSARIMATRTDFTPRDVRDQLKELEPLLFKVEVLAKLVPKARNWHRNRKTNVDNAKEPRKVGEALRERIVRQYGERVRAGQKYGALKDLAAEHGVTAKTISTIVAEEKIRK
jgi:hypothetical protein